MTVYRIRITIHPDTPLFQAEGLVWRDVELNDSHMLKELHAATFDAFDRVNEHAYEFTAFDKTGDADQRYVDPLTYGTMPAVKPVVAEEVE